MADSDRLGVISHLFLFLFIFLKRLLLLPAEMVPYTHIKLPPSKHDKRCRISSPAGCKCAPAMANVTTDSSSEEVVNGRGSFICAVLTYLLKNEMSVHI